MRAIVVGAGFAGLSAAEALRRAGVDVELLDSLDLDPGAREAIRARLEVSTANVAEAVDAAALADIPAHGADECPSVAGGNQGIALALARELGAAVHLSSPVERVVRDAA